MHKYCYISFKNFMIRYNSTELFFRLKKKKKYILEKFNSHIFTRLDVSPLRYNNFSYPFVQESLSSREKNESIKRKKYGLHTHFRRITLFRVIVYFLLSKLSCDPHRFRWIFNAVTAGWTKHYSPS